MKTIRILSLSFLALTLATGHVGAQSTDKTITSAIGGASSGIKSLWKSTPQKMAPAVESGDARFCGIAPDGNFLFQLLHGEGGPEKVRRTFVVLDSKNGATLQVLGTEPPTEGTVEWTSESRWLPDGRFLDVGHTFIQASKRAGIRFRVIDTAVGKVTERLIAFDNPSQDGLSNRPVGWIGMMTTATRMTGDVFRLRNNAFLAELDSSSLKTKRFLEAPSQGRVLIDTPLKNGCTWHFQSGAASQSDKVMYTQFGAAPKEVSLEESKKLHEDQIISEVTHPRTADPVVLESSQVESKIEIKLTDSKSIEADIGRDNSEATAKAIKCGEYLIIEVRTKLTESGSKQIGHMVFSLDQR